jgi:two-component system response regulator YesN
VDRVARAMYLSRAQFARRMRQETGKSFVEFLNDYRMEEAKVLLQDSDWTVRVIAGFLGFQSSTYFQTVFRRSCGLSPSQYRAKTKK